MSSLQSDFRRLMSEIYENTHKVTIHDPNLMDVVSTEISPYQEEDGLYILDDDKWERFQQIADRYEVDAWEEYKDPMDEMSTSSAAGAYNASLHAKPKQYKGPELEESSNPQSGNAAPFGSGYKAVKGFRAGHTKDKGGFQYKDLWNLNEDQFNELVSRTDKNKIDRLLDLVKDKAPQLYSKFTNWMLDPYTAHEFEDYKNDAKSQGIDLSAIGLAEREEIEQGEFKIGDKVEIVGKWPDKSYGKVISFDDDLVAVNVTKGGGSTYERQMMIPHDQLRLQGSEIKKKEKKEKAKEMEKEPIKEGLKTEIKVRSKKQQFQEATKLANKKLKEINHILEYASNLKSDLNEREYSSSSKAMESMKKSIAEAYKKMKSL